MWGLLLSALLLAQPADPAAAAPTPSAPAIPEADVPTVGAALGRHEALVGDRLTLTLSAVARAGIEVTLPQRLDLGKLEVIDRDDGDKNGRDLGDGRRSYKFVLGIAAYEVGTLEVPPIELSYLTPRGDVRTIKTEPLEVTIKGLVADEEPKAEVQPIKPPRSAMVEDKRVIAVLKWGGVGLGVALALFLVWRLARRFARRRSAAVLAAGPVGPTRPPDEIAMEKLRALREAGGFSAHEYRPFYFAVAEVVRAYLGARYRFDSLELTTHELLAALATRAPHLCEPGGDLVRFLADTDLVKFAKTGSSDASALAALDAAQALVLSTAAPLEEAAQSISGPVRLPRGPSEDAHG